MTVYVNTEEMRRSASQMDNAAENMRRASGQFDDAVFRLEKLIGSGYGNNIERLVEALEQYNKLQEPTDVNETIPTCRIKV